MNTLIGFFNIFHGYPWIVLVVFIIIVMLVLRALGGRDTLSVLSGMGKIMLSFFVAPFRFLKLMMVMFKKTKESELPYQNSHEHLLYIANRLNYLALAIFTVLVLAGGLSSTLVALYPQQEISQRKLALEKLNSATATYEKAKELLQNIQKPEYLERLKSLVDIASKDFSQKSSAFDKAQADLLSEAGETLNLSGIIKNITTADDANAAATNITQNINENCPNYYNFPSNKCPSLIQKITNLGTAQAEVNTAWSAYTEANKNLDSFDTRKHEVEVIVQTATEEVSDAQVIYDGTDLLNFRWIGNHLKFAGVTLSMTIGWVILIIWLGALFLEFFSWIISIMLSLERKNQNRTNCGQCGTKLLTAEQKFCQACGQATVNLVATPTTPASATEPAPLTSSDTIAKNFKAKFTDLSKKTKIILAISGVVLPMMVIALIMLVHHQHQLELNLTGELIEIPDNSYEIGKFEVTQAQWQAVMGNNPSYFKGDNLPVEEVSWDDIQRFLKRLNAKTGKQYRLPTEAEWEVACYGGSETEYCGGNDANAVAWYDGNSGGKTHSVGQKQANGYGLYDMSGNVWEWQQDWYDSSQQGRVLRGGAWLNDAQDARAANRSGGVPARRGDGGGFRLARTLP